MDTSEIPTPDANGNYDSPPLKALRRVWGDFEAGVATDTDVMDVIVELGRFAQHQLGLFEKKIESGASNPEDPGFSLILEAFEMVLEGCEYMALEFVEPDPEDQVEEPEEGFFACGLGMIQEATNQMMEGHQLTLEHIEASSVASCPFCAQKNPRDQARCGKCGRALPQNEAPQVDPEFSAVQQEGLEAEPAAGSGGVTENYLVLAQSVEDWREGSLTAEELGQILEAIERRLLAHLEDTEQQEKILRQAPAGQQEALAQAVSMTQNGLEASLAAIERMRLAFEKEDDTYLQLGLSNFEEASKLMVRSFLASREAARPPRSSGS